MTGFEMILPFLRPIQAHILDPDVSEIMVNGPEQVFIERGGYLEHIDGVSLNEKSLMVAVKNIARRLGDDISEEKPILDSRLPDGSRVAAVIPPCSLNGIALTIRKFNARHFGIDDLIRIGTITEELADRFADAVRTRKNILISGGTGTGKTTLLNILANFIPDGERVLVIEDTAEIQIRTSNLVRFEARRAQNGLPAVTIRELLKASLRHRPDRILLGEIRGGEAFDLLQLLNTGHSGTLSTVHANSAHQALSRFTTCVLQSEMDLPYRGIKSNIADSLNLLVQIERRLLLRSDFVRLSSGSDAHSYARRLIEDEKSSAQTSNVAPLGHPEASSTAQQDETPLSRAQASEEAVRRYITENAQDDWLAIFVRNSETGDVVQRVSPAQRIAGSDYQRWLRYMNAHGSDVYMSLNTFRDHAQGRTKADLKEIRHLYLDIDHEGPERLAAVLSDDTAPTPNYVFNTSPGKFQVVWRVEGFGPDEAESALRALVQRFGGDPAATDSTRVFRLPGFSNKKYEQDFQVTIRSEAPPNLVYRPEDFRVPSPEREQSPTASHSHREPARTNGGNLSQSERDLAYAIRHLKAGDDPDEIIRAIAGYRSVDQYDKRNPARVSAHKKPKPQYYAELTVTKAMANLGITRPAQAKAPAPAEKFGGEAELGPNR